MKPQGGVATGPGWDRRRVGHALPRSEVLTAQNARVDGVSGATYTSEAYAASLQAALDALHLK